MKKSWINDTVGGAVAGLLAVPEAMAYAVIIFSPLAVHRPDILPLGIISCILTVVLANAIPCVMGGPRILISTPFSLAAVMMGVLATQIVVAVTPVGGEPDLELALVLLLAVVSVSGIIQIFFGLLRLGDLAKFAPTPVIAGLRNGAAVVIIMTQVRPLLGLGAGNPITLEGILWPTMLIGVLCIAVMWLGPRLTKKVPGAVIAIAVGTAAYYALAAMGWSAQLTGVVGEIPSAVPAPRFADDLFALITSKETLDLLLPLLPIALGLAILNTLQTLIAIVTADNLAEVRSDSNRELVGHGLSNLLCGAFGAMSASGAVGGTLANFGSGGRGLLSRLSASGLALAVILFLGPIIGSLPKIVLVGCLIALALSMFDRPSLKLLLDTFARRVSLRDAAKDLSVITTVMVILLIFSPLAAVGAGVLVALGHFLLSMSADNVRREFSGSSIRSHVHRNDKEYEALIEMGKRIHIMELDGPLFFGTSDRLATRVEARSKENMEFIVLDFTRVSEIDTTAVSLICQTRNACKKNNTQLILCSLETKPSIARSLKSTKLYDVFEPGDIHVTLDDGLAHVEDLLLDREFGPGRYEREFAAAEVGVLKAIGSKQLALLQPHLARCTFSDAEEVFAQGEKASAIYFILRGQASIESHFDGSSRRKLGILCPGAVFGEMAVLDGKPRSASIVAVGKLVCLKLNIRSLKKLGREQPETLHALMTAIGLELSKRIRISNRALSALKSSF